MMEKQSNENTKYNRKLIITRYKSCIVSALYFDGKAVELSIEPEESGQILGNIYIGKVKNIMKNIQAAFIEIESGLPCYYAIEENQNPVFTRKTNSPKLVSGDELLVQVDREGMKTKAPSVTSTLSFTGKYLVLTSGKCRIGLSGKLSDSKKKELRELIEGFKSEQYGWIIRTNAKDASAKEILKEAKNLKAQYESLMNTAKHRTCYSVLYKTPQNHLTQLRDIYGEYLESILTDDRELFNSMSDFLREHQGGDQEKLSFYEDSLLPLKNMYNLEGVLNDALRERVWLKSGAYLVIQPTEALTAIDVNTGKFDSKKKDQEDTFLKINLEAAKEIARQLRLRNLSGIIIVDFINLKSLEYRKKLMDEFNHYLQQDPIKAVLVDMTALNLVEVTRKKVRKSLAEQARYLID